MGKIFIIMGKSATGKDTVLKRLLEASDLGLRTCILYTTRPMRVNEADGVEYHFRDEAHLADIMARGLLIEQRTYPSMHGDWHYYMVDDESIDLAAHDYAIIGTIDSYLSVRKYYGKDFVIPILIECDERARFSRAAKRELGQDDPKCLELCRRFLADEQDFSHERKTMAGITKAFENKRIVSCVNNIKAEIRKCRQAVGENIL